MWETDRLAALRKALGLSQRKFAERLGIKANAVSMIEVGRNALTEKNIRLICMTFQVSEAWLRTGEGDMFVASPYEAEFIRTFRSLMPETQEALLQLGKRLLETQRKLGGANPGPPDMSSPPPQPGLPDRP
jgi:transcriptional regulator with XRE-family HTH domain